MIGTRLANRYELLEQLGAGGMGVVYRAHDPRLERDVAVKTVPPWRLDEKSEERFRREARIVAQLDHPAIVPIHDFGHHEELLFYVMPLVEGVPLSELIAEGALAPEEAVAVAAEVADALSHAHDRGVIHRDVKPSNVMVARDNGELRARVMDFGLAQGIRDPHTSYAGMVGTPAYLSPEQMMGQELDPRADIYSLGAVLYECLAGEPPFEGSLATILYRIGHDPPESLRGRGVEIDSELENIVLWCLAKRPEARPPDARTLAAALNSYLRGSSSSSAGEPGPWASAAVAPLSPASPPPLVGRRRERSGIRERLRMALAGECQTILLGGEAGVGKSRLLRDIETLAIEERLTVLRGRYSDLEESFHYEGLCELVQDYFRGAAAPPDLSDLAPDLLGMFPMLTEISELRRAAGAPRPPAGTSRGPSWVYELFARTLIRLADGEPLVLLLENLHEADASIEALKYLVHRLAPTPTLIAGTYRSGETGRGHPLRRWIRSLRDQPRALVLELEPLAPDELRRLAAHLVGSSRIRDELLDRLYEATEGNPLFACELVRSLLETGDLVRDSSGSWSLVGEAALAARGSLPATLQQAVERRLERLPAELHAILDVAAVLGRTFDAADLEAVIAEPLAGDELDEALDQLSEHGLLKEDRTARGDRFAFTSGLVRTVLYGDLSSRRRRAIHRRYARYLEERAGERPERFYPALVRHFGAGDEPAKTVRYALAQARWSLSAWNPEDAIRAARIGLEFLEEGEVADFLRWRGELLEVSGRAHRALGQNRRAYEKAGKAVADYLEAGETARAAEASWLAARAAWQARRIEDGRRWVDRTAELARAAGDPAGEPDGRPRELLRGALLLGSTIANLRGESHVARRYREEAARLDPAPGPCREPPVPRGGTLRLALPVAIDRLDPAEIDSDENLEVVTTVFETLLRTDGQGNLLPNLASDWEVSGGGRRFVLTLAPDVLFSDGRALTAGDVKASFERLARHRTDAPPPALAALAGRRAYAGGEAPALAGIETPAGEPRRLVFHLDEPLPIFPVLLTDPYTAISSRGKGTGPFQLAALADQRVVLERNPRFRGEPPRLDQLELYTAVRSSAIAEGLRTGKIDLGRDLLLADLEELLRDPRFRSGLVETIRKNVHFLLWNRDGPCARHAELRRALAGVVDRSDLVWRTLGRFAQPAVCLMPPGVPGHDPGRRLRHLSPEQARGLLAKTGLPAPLRLSALAHPVIHNRGRDLLRALFGEWSRLGVEVECPEIPLAEFLDAYRNHRAVDLLIGRWNADYDDPDAFTYGLFHSRHGLFRRYYASAKADRLLERARHETSMPERLALYRRFESLLAAEDDFLPLFHDVAYRLAGPRVRGLRLDSAPPYVGYAALGKERAADGATPPWTLERGELHVPIVAPIATLDPVGETFAEHFEVVSTIFEGLTRLDENAAVVPWLAESLEASSDSRRYRLRLRGDVRFHDGRRLTARDVRYSFERALRQPWPGLSFLQLPIRGARALRQGETGALAGVEIVSPTELVLELEDPLPFFPALLAHPGAGIVAEGSGEKSGGFAASWRQGCVGTGPFRVLRFEEGRAVDLERHPQYWRRGFPRCERLTFHCGLDPRRIAAGFREGSYSLACDLRGADVEALRRDPDLARGALETPRLSTLFLVLNARHGPLADQELRRALAGALDVDSLFREAAAPQAPRARGLIPPGLLGHDEPRRAAEPPATGTLAGLRLKVAAVPGCTGQYASLWDELQRALRLLGFRVEVVSTPVSDLPRAASRGAADVLCLRWLADYPDPDSFVSPLLHSRAGVVAGMCGRREIDLLCERGRRELDPALRHAVYRELEELLAREALVVPVLHEQSYRFCHPSIEGVRAYFALPEVRYEEIRVGR